MKRSERIDYRKFLPSKFVNKKKIILKEFKKKKRDEKNVKNVKKGIKFHQIYFFITTATIIIVKTIAITKAITPINLILCLIKRHLTFLALEWNSFEDCSKS